MRLRNKKTGEIEDFTPTLNRWNGPIRDIRYYNSLAELNEEWEDVPEEPKEHWAIDQFGEPINVSGLSRLQLEKLRQYGNEFETKEEAEKAVEKLKAWKRLEDKGFRVIDYGDEDIRYEIKDRYDGCLSDLETMLFGGKE